MIILDLRIIEIANVDDDNKPMVFEVTLINWAGKAPFKCLFCKDYYLGLR